jgi:hypothetical protein
MKNAKTSALTILTIRKPSACRFICFGISKVIYKYAQTPEAITTSGVLFIAT